MNELLNKLIDGEPVTDHDIEQELHDVCNRVHSGCDDSCPVYEKNGNALGHEKPWEENRGCDCFKNGKAMLEFLRS